MDLEKLYLTRQSTREYSEKPVTDDVLKEICRLACLAPSAVNSQPFKLHAVNGDRAKEFAPFVQPGGGNAFASQCTAFIAIEEGNGILREREDGTKYYKTEFVPIDIGIMTAYLVLAAENLGVQSCILGRRDERAIAEYFGLDKNTRFPLVIALGYKKDSYPVRAKNRRDFAEAFKLYK